MVSFGKVRRAVLISSLMVAGFLAWVGMSKAAPPTAEKPVAAAPSLPDDEVAPKPRDLGPPIGCDPKDLVPLGKYAAWVDKQQRQIVLVGEACKADYPLEFFVTSRSRAYESVLVVDADRREPGSLSLFQYIHQALLLLGLRPGKPSIYVEKEQKMSLATGDSVLVEVRWKDKKGTVHDAPAQDWIRSVKSKKAVSEMKDANGEMLTWVFCGSRFSKDDEGKEHYLGDSGDFLCVLNNPVAMLDLPVESAGAIEARSFEAFSERMPPPGTAVTIVLKAKKKK